MQVTETLSEGLKREYRITVPAKDLDGRIANRLEEIKTKVKINGFRPGKVPAAHLKRVYGRSVFGEILQELMTEANRKIVDDNKVKLAMQPKVSLPEEESEVEKVVEGKADLTYTVAVEVLPEIKIGDLKSLSVEKPVADIQDDEVNETLTRLATQNATYEPKDGKAELKDKVTIDFVGSIDGVEFDGGKGEDHPLILGSGQFIPGFEEQLVGVKAGDKKDVKVGFPADYRATDLAGKDAVFAVTVKEVAGANNAAIDDELAKKLGMESVDKLKEAVKDQIGSGYKQASRQRLKRSLLDALDATHKFDLPPTLVEQEFAQIWSQVEKELASGGDKVREGKTDDQLKAEYRTISERRVRLGLLLAEIGEKNDIQVTNDEVTKAVVDRARQFPGQEQMVWEFYQKNPEALAELRAPIFEEKVVDYIVELAKVTEKKVTKEELFADPDDDKAA
ncbi:trigger factor [Terrihabitans soli]|uniref:Trigger factor n=1 Tax=Terrihabitans soli TaxID=708113 RepID=A0A6S6QK71_9HYPH|nr:trigger factor [Terrihabitans soli]BCJ90734.1 trigger factor [Terrihabitans soli]